MVQMLGQTDLDNFIFGFFTDKMLTFPACSSSVVSRFWLPITVFNCRAPANENNKIRGVSQKYVGNLSYYHVRETTVNFLNIRTPKKFVVITLKLKLCGSTIE